MTDQNSTDPEPDETPYVDDYLSRNEGIVLSSSTVRTYRYRLQQYVRFLTENETTVLDAELDDVVAFIERCVRRGNRESTLSGKLTAIEQLYRHIKLKTDAADDLRLEPLELEAINLGQYNTPPALERVALTREEVRRLFDAMDSYRNRLLAVTATETGLRNSDLRELLVCDVVFDELMIHVRNPKNEKPYDVPISRDLGFELEWWLGGRREAFTTASESQYLFPGQNSPKLETNSGLNRIIKTAAEKADLQDIIGVSRVKEEARSATDSSVSERRWHRVTPHTLRHTYLTLLKDAHVPLPYRQLVANHTSPETTRGYTHGEDGAFQTIRDRFDPPR
ncbi:tyrosine-type recombinase/integrase [Halorientalis salina]|uniref:tyrosine-type recombinase/integrase n=1 Tax=Halorientalis salina TaxID=2932266 RepID=UPI0010AD9F42|nr:site-specific integrase [Halorientalis salina]